MLPAVIPDIIICYTALLIRYDLNDDHHSLTPGDIHIRHPERRRHLYRRMFKQHFIYFGCVDF